MSYQDKWLKCTISDGMLPKEYAVVCNSSDGTKFSFFAPKEYIDIKNSLVKVRMMECASDRCLVYVPFDPLEGTSRTVVVSTQNIVNM